MGAKHAPSEAKVSLTENINMHASGGELDGLYTFPLDWIGFKFSRVEFGELDVDKNKNLEDVTVEQLQAEARCIVQHPGFEETGEGRLRLHLFVTKHHYTALSGFSFSLFYILLFSVHIVNVNAVKSGTVLDNLSVNIDTFFFQSSGHNLRNKWLGSFFYQSTAF